MTKETSCTCSTTCLEESSALREGKEDRIRLCCLAQDDVDLWRLRELALTKGGLVNGMWKKLFMSLNQALNLFLAPSHWILS